jgi:heme/copper-type cytochrome/quinol oxidase subunit 3
MNAIPYTVERRPDTGVNNVQLGMWLFLASEAMLFGGLFSAYFMLRAGAPAPWLPLSDHLSGAVLATVNVILATAGVAAAGRYLQRYRLCLGIASVFGVIFCLRKAADYQHFIAAGLGPAASTQMATYFLLTGVHLLHVAGGVLANLFVVVRSGAAPDPAPTANRLRALTLYWTFVDVVWLAIFVMLYVV